MRTIDTHTFPPGTTSPFPFRILLFLPVFLGLSFGSCTTPFGVYIRNTSKNPAVIDVYLLNKSRMRNLPNQVAVAQKVVTFKAGFHKYFVGYETVHWMDTSHFQLKIYPNTSIDLTDMTGRWVNSHPRNEVRVLVTTADRIDTLVTGTWEFDADKFGYKMVGLINPLLYYDIRDPVTTAN